MIEDLIEIPDRARNGGSALNLAAEQRRMAATGCVPVYWFLAMMASVALAEDTVHGPQPNSTVARQSSGSQATVAAPAATISLNIPDTGQEERRPDSGWCGEAAIQMALSHYGMYVSQRTINRAGKPIHPDLYANEIPVR